MYILNIHKMLSLRGLRFHYIVVRQNTQNRFVISRVKIYRISTADITLLYNKLSISSSEL